MKSTKTLIVTNPEGMTARGPESYLERIVLNVCGGGLFEDQTMRAMELAHVLRDTGKAEHNGWKLRLEQIYTLYVAPGTNRCRLYLMPYPMREGQSPADLKDSAKDAWEHVGELNSQLKVVYLDERLHHLHSELEGTMGGTYFELDGGFQFVDGPALKEVV